MNNTDSKASSQTAPGVVSSERVMPQHHPGDVFQINERHGRKGWMGAFVLATEIKTWGIQGFVAHIETHEQQNRAYIRLKWDEIDFVGHAPLVPSDEAA